MCHKKEICCNNTHDFVRSKASGKNQHSKERKLRYTILGNLTLAKKAASIMCNSARFLFKRV